MGYAKTITQTDKDELYAAFVAGDTTGKITTKHFTRGYAKRIGQLGLATSRHNIANWNGWFITKAGMEAILLHLVNCYRDTGLTPKYYPDRAYYNMIVTGWNVLHPADK